MAAVSALSPWRVCLISHTCQNSSLLHGSDTPKYWIGDSAMERMLYKNMTPCSSGLFFFLFFGPRLDSNTSLCRLSCTQAFDSCFVNSRLARWSTRPRHREPGSRRSLLGCLFLVWFSLPCKYYTHFRSLIRTCERLRPCCTENKRAL